MLLKGFDATRVFFGKFEMGLNYLYSSEVLLVIHIENYILLVLLFEAARCRVHHM